MIRLPEGAFKMHWRLIATGGLAAAACAYVAFCAWIAFVPPRNSADYVLKPLVVAPACHMIEGSSNAYKGGPLECQDLLDETEQMRQNPGLATRDGRNLTIFYGGEQVARLVAAQPGDQEYDSFTMPQVLHLRDPQSRTLQSFADITSAHGEFTFHFVVLPEGGRWFVADASASPDGR